MEAEIKNEELKMKNPPAGGRGEKVKLRPTSSFFIFNSSFIISKRKPYFPE